MRCPHTWRHFLSKKQKFYNFDHFRPDDPLKVGWHLRTFLLRREVVPPRGVLGGASPIRRYSCCDVIASSCDMVWDWLYDVLRTAATWMRCVLARLIGARQISSCIILCMLTMYIIVLLLYCHLEISVNNFLSFNLNLCGLIIYSYWLFRVLWCKLLLMLMHNWCKLICTYLDAPV